VLVQRLNRRLHKAQSDINPLLRSLHCRRRDMMSLEVPSRVIWV
jgi:hypothetical protein